MEWTFFARLFCFPNTDQVSISRRFEALSCSFERLRTSMKMSHFEKKNSLWISSHDLYGENNILKRKRSIVVFIHT